MATRATIRTAIIARPSTAPTASAGQCRPDRELGCPAALAQPDGQGVAAEGGGAGHDKPGELEGPVVGWELVGGRLQREAERGRGQEEHHHQSGHGPEPAPTTRVQNTPFPQLHRDHPTDGVDQREQPDREGITAGSAG